MASIKTKFTVGLFIAIGIVLTIVAVLWLGMSNYLEKGQRYVAYFDESVQGLTKDSPVKYRGVPIGRVVSIGVAPDGTLIQVVMKIETGLEPEANGGSIVAQLKSVGITGITFVELDRREKGAPNLSPKLSFTPRYPVIATKPSGMKMFLEGLNDVLNQIKTITSGDLFGNISRSFAKFDRAIDSIQVQKVSSDFRLVLENINRILNEPEVQETLKSLGQAARSAESLMSSAQNTVGRFDRMLAVNEKGIAATVADARRAARNADNVTAQLDRMVGANSADIQAAIARFSRAAGILDNMLNEGLGLVKRGDTTFSDLQPRLLAAMRELEIAIENLRRFSENISRQPSQLLLSTPPEGRRFEPKR